MHQQHPRTLQGHAEDRGAPSALSPTLHTYHQHMPTYAARANRVRLSTRRRSALPTKTRCA
jgi:hypothetical protein